jgi:hypothetical protein
MGRVAQMEDLVLIGGDRVTQKEGPAQVKAKSRNKTRKSRGPDSQPPGSPEVQTGPAH